MMDIGPGDWVECCIPSSRGHEPEAWQKPLLTVIGPWPINGCIYRVREVGEYPSNGRMVPGVRLFGTKVSYPGWPDCYFPADSFRPLRRPPSADLIEQLKRPVRQEVDA